MFIFILLASDRLNLNFRWKPTNSIVWTLEKKLLPFFPFNLYCFYLWHAITCGCILFVTNTFNSKNLFSITLDSLLCMNRERQISGDVKIQLAYLFKACVLTNGYTLNLILQMKWFKHSSTVVEWDIEHNHHLHVVVRSWQKSFKFKVS